MVTGGGAAPSHFARLRSGHDRRAWTALDYAIRGAGQARRGLGRWLGRGNGRAWECEEGGLPWGMGGGVSCRLHGPAMCFAVAGQVFWMGSAGGGVGGGFCRCLPRSMNRGLGSWARFASACRSWRVDACAAVAFYCKHAAARQMRCDDANRRVKKACPGGLRRRGRRR